MEPDGLLIWWIDSDDCRMVEAASVLMPPYIRAELRSRVGRNGRGRLWVSLDIQEESVVPIRVLVWDDAKATARAIAARSCGGIAFRARDLPAVAGLPGFVTDFNLDLVTAR